MTEPSDPSEEPTHKALTPAVWVTGLIVLVAGLLALFALT